MASIFPEQNKEHQKRYVMKNLIFPPPLIPGDRAALAAPASPVSPDALDIAVRSLKAIGLDPVVMPGCRENRGYLSGTDEQRAKDINDAFRSDDIKGIFCIRGGYGSMRILRLLDYEMISKHPKVFAGFSDITAIHTALNEICRFVTFHAPMPAADYQTFDNFTLDSLKKHIFRTPVCSPLHDPPGTYVKILHPGKACGQITGGNLSMMAALLGTPFEPDTRGRIVFLEDVNEPLYKIDRMLTSLSLAGKFDGCAGIVLGSFENCPPDCERAHGPCALAELFCDALLPFDVPVISNLRFGHTYPQLTFASGAAALLDTESSTPLRYCLTADCYR